MADFAIDPTLSLQFAAGARTVLTPSTGARAPGTDIPAALNAERTIGGVPLNVASARESVSASLVAGRGVLSALKTLRDAFRLATSEGLTGPLTSLTVDGTRISGVTITAQGGRLVKAIDSLVDSAGVRGANLISSTSGRVTIQTTQFGGRLTISPQPLDSVGLGLTNLKGITRAEALSAVARIDNAISVARSRIDNLEVLQGSLQPGRGISSEITRLLDSGPTGFLPRGTLVNQVA